MSISNDVYKFVAALERLEDGERAKLKRNAGQTLNDSRDVMGLFYNKLLRDMQVKEWDEETYFLVATLYPFDKRRAQQQETAETNQAPGEEAELAKEKRRPSFGVSLRGIRSEKNGNGLDRRVERLLDADVHQLPFYLRREVQFVTNEGGHINWPHLLDDLLKWGHPDRYVQRNWARDYFTYQPAKEPAN